MPPKTKRTQSVPAVHHSVVKSYLIWVGHNLQGCGLRLSDSSQVILSVGWGSGLRPACEVDSHFATPLAGVLPWEVRLNLCLWGSLCFALNIDALEGAGDQTGRDVAHGVVMSPLFLHAFALPDYVTTSYAPTVCKALWWVSWGTQVLETWFLPSHSGISEPRHSLWQLNTTPGSTLYTAHLQGGPDQVLHVPKGSSGMSTITLLGKVPEWQICRRTWHWGKCA